MCLNSILQTELENQGVDFFCFVDINHLSSLQSKGYPTAILFGICLSQEFIQKVIDTPDYVQYIRKNHLIDQDEFHQKEVKTDKIADYISNFLESLGYRAYSQSENNILKTGYFNETTKSTPLPHKTIARLAGLGWIGKHNLFVHTEFAVLFQCVLC